MSHFRSIDSRCLRRALLAGLLTLLFTQYASAQDAVLAAPQLATTWENPAIWLELFKVAGLPGVVVLLVLRQQKLQLPVAPIVATITLDDATRKLMRIGVKELRMLRRATALKVGADTQQLRTSDNPDSLDGDEDI